MTVRLCDTGGGGGRCQGQHQGVLMRDRFMAPGPMRFCATSMGAWRWPASILDMVGCSSLNCIASPSSDYVSSKKKPDYGLVS